MGLEDVRKVYLGKSGLNALAELKIKEVKNQFSL